MAYSLADQVALVSKYKETNPALAYAIYNGFSGMGGGPSSGGALDIALRDAWGPDAAKNWVNSGGGEKGASGGAADYGFDPNTGEYSSWSGDKGTLAGYSGANYDPNAGRTAMAANPTLSYDPTHAASNLPGPTGVGLNSAQWMRNNPDNTYTGVQYGAVPPGGYPRTPPGTPPPTVPGSPAARGTSLATLSRTTGSSPTPYQVPGSTGHPGGNNPTPDPLQGPGRPPTQYGDPNAPVGGGVPGNTPPPGGGITPPGGGGAPKATGTNGGSGPLGTSGASGAVLPTADAATYTPYVADPRNPESTKPFDLYNDEGYKFLLKEAQDATNGAAATRGNLASGATLKALQDRAAGLASQEYDKAYGRYDTNRKFDEGVYENDRTFGNNQSIDSRNYNNENRKFDYTANETQRKDARDFDFMEGKDARDYETGLALTNRDFDYKVQTGDRTFNSETLKSLAGMGLNASSNNAQIATILSKIFGDNTMTGAGANAAGGVGQAQNWLDLIGQFNKILTPTIPPPTTGGGH